MRFFVVFTFVVAIAFMIGLDVVLFCENALYGVGGIIGIIAFFIAYSISGDMIVAPRDYWRLSNWEVFKKKFGYGFGAFVMVSFLVAAILGACFA